MLYKTRGIVLKVTDYAESSVVAKIFTEKFGLQSYILNGVKKPKAKINLNMLQPLHLLEMVVYHKPNGNIQKVSDLRNVPLLQSIPYDIIKSSIAIFLDEMIYKSLKQQSDDAVLFEFIFKAIELLDHTQKNTGNFHLVFLMKLTRFLGFYPDMSFADTSLFFDLKNGVFTSYQPGHSFFVDTTHMPQLLMVLRSSLQNYETLKIDAAIRKYLLGKIIDFYSLHIDGFGVVKSLEILEEVLG